MTFVHNISSIVVCGLLAGTLAAAEPNAPIADNAALRYWSAFAEVQDSGITSQQAKELTAMLNGKVQYEDSKYKDLLEKNKLALEIMARGTSLLHCDWGLDYGLGSELPVDYARKGLVLGRLNLLATLRLLRTRNVDGAVHALAAGLRFSRDVGNGGSLFATLVAKSLLVGHLRVVAETLRSGQLSAAQRSELRTAVAGLGNGLDWPMAARRDLEGLRQHYAGNSQTAAALSRIISSYVAALGDESKLPAVNRAMEGAPQDLADVIPNVKGVLEAKQDLDNALQQARFMLQ